MRDTRQSAAERARAEPVTVTDYNPDWPRLFDAECIRLRRLLPPDLIGKIHHIGSTAVPGLAAKPIVDMLVEVPDLETVRSRIAPLLEAAGYTFLWRPVSPGDVNIDYAWFIRRDRTGRRTHHIHMVPPGSPYFDRLTFRDYLRGHLDAAQDYAALKKNAARLHHADRAAYARAKSAFIKRTLREAE